MAAGLEDLAFFDRQFFFADGWPRVGGFQVGGGGYGVELLGWNCPVGQDRDNVVDDLNETAVDVEPTRDAAAADA